MSTRTPQPEPANPMIDRLTARTVAECTSAEVAQALNRAFQGYIVPVTMSAESYERRLRGEDLDPFASRIFFHQEEPAAAMLVTRRGWTSRIAAMAIVPELRARRLGRALLEAAIRDARDRGDRCMMLEVFEQNTRALRLYASLGFRPHRRLLGYRRQGGAGSGEVPEALTEIDPLHLARMVSAQCDADLPWMLAPETLSAASAPARAYSLNGRAAALVTDPAHDTVVLSALVVERASRRRGLGSRLLHALEVTLPGRTWVIPPIIPEELAERFLTGLGWERQVRSQYEMRLDLRSARS
jgi:ribosomal protein S18 acetylase RimI-like enzyme